MPAMEWLNELLSDSWLSSLMGEQTVIEHFEAVGLETRLFMRGYKHGLGKRFGIYGPIRFCFWYCNVYRVLGACFLGHVFGLLEARIIVV